MKKYLFLFLSLFFIGCSSKQEETGYSHVGMKDEAADMKEEAAVDNQSSALGENLIGEKVIQTIYVEYETLLYDEAVQKIMSAIQSEEAYIEYSYESKYSPTGSFDTQTRQFRQIEYTIRVPKEKVGTFLESLAGMTAEKISEQIGSEDATKNYRDTETRLRVLNDKEARLNELLEQAETIEQILQIEDNLSQTIAEKEMLQGQLNQIDDLIDYTAVHLRLTEKQRISGSNKNGTSFFQRIGDALIDSLYNFYYWVQDAVIWFIFAAPYILLLIFIFIILILVLKLIRKKKK